MNRDHLALQLETIYFQKKTGVLHFRYNEIQKAFFFQNGKLIFAKTNQESELLGEVLHQLGKITDDVYSKIEDFIEPLQRIGAILVQKDVISKSDLSEALKHQMREISLNIFPIFGGDYKFVEKSDFGPLPFEVNLALPAVIEDGIRRMRFQPRVKEFFAEKRLYPRNREFVHRLSQDEKKILSGIRSLHKTEEIREELGFPPEMYWKSLFLMFCLGIVGFEEDKDSTKKPQPKAVPLEEETDLMEDNLKEILDLHQRLDSLNYYQVLEVTNKASAEDVKQAYFSLARRYHPDLFARDLVPDLKDKIADVFDRLTKAYRTLSDELKREEYDTRQAETLGGGERHDAMKQADIKFRQGKTLFNQARYEEAMVYLEQAIRQKSGQSSYHLLLAMTHDKIPGHDIKAEENFLKAIELDPWNPEAYVGIGMLYKKEGMKIKAARFLKKALSIDDGHRLARKELAEIEEPRGKSSWKDLLKGDFLGRSRKK